MQNHCTSSVREIDAAELQQMLNRQKDYPPPLIIDVRQPQEYQQSHIPGALLIPLGQLEVPHPALVNPARPTVVYCRSGKRSMAGAMILCRMGYQDLMSLKGGILGWHFETLSGPSRAVLSQEEANSVQDLLTLAMGREMLAQGLYRQWSIISKEEPVKKLLQELFFREAAHMDAIYNRYLSWCGENDTVPLDRDQLRAAAVSPEEEKTDAPFSSAEELLELAVAREFEAYNFYRTSAELTSDEELRGLLFDLSFEERTHASSLLHLLTDL